MDTNPGLAYKKFTNQEQCGSSGIIATLILGNFSIDSCVPGEKRCADLFMFLNCCG